MNHFKNFDTYTENAMASWHCPGVVIKVTKGDEILHQGVYGLRDVEAKLPMTLDASFPIASITKSFTAMCIALLVEEGKLTWDTPVRDYAPEFILHDAYATQHMTIRDLLSHRTGLPGHFWASYRLDIELSELVRRLRHLEFNSSFREKWQYNNAMYIAIGYLVEKLAGQPWQDFLHERIFSPLGMSASAASLDLVSTSQEIAKGYKAKRDDEGKVAAISHVPFGPFSNKYPGAAGGVFSTVTDLTTWLKAQLRDAHGLVSAENLRQMHLPHAVIPLDELAEDYLGVTSFSYGLGWHVESYKGHRLFSHSGELEGHTAWTTFIPKKNIAVVVLTNLTGSPLAHVLTRESIDRALNLALEDWNSKIHADVDSFYSEEAKNNKNAAEERIADVPPSQPLEEYAGIYQAPGYPDVAVRFRGKRLEACRVGSSQWSELRHYHFDTFEWYVPAYDFWMKILFGVDSNGKMSRLTAPLEPAISDIIFEREMA